MELSYNERISLLRGRLNLDYLNHPGNGGELKFSIFDYDSKDELKIRKEIEKIVSEDSSIIKFDLYDMMIELIKNEGYFDNIIEMEKTYPTNVMLNEVLQPLLALEQDDNPIIRMFKERAIDDGNRIILICGVGKAYPIIRSHTILNNLQSVFKNNPVVMFYPGSYDSKKLMTLRLFDRLDDDNYYRAFSLVQRSN